MNRMLCGQLRRSAGLRGVAEIEVALTQARDLALRPDVSPELGSLLSGLKDLLARVGASYDHYDRDMELRVRSLQHCSDELNEINLRLLHLSRVDPLTGLLNRAYWQKRAQEEFHRALVTNSPASLAMLDIDDFKAINDTYGHLVGDEVIQSVAGALRESCRSADICGRYGGEEFGVVLPGVKVADAFEFCNRFRQRVERMRFQVGTPVLNLTMSLGVSEVKACDDSLMGWLRRYDQALYRAKAAGRNRVCVAEG